MLDLGVTPLFTFYLCCEERQDHEYLRDEGPQLGDPKE